MPAAMPGGGLLASTLGRLFGAVVTERGVHGNLRLAVSYAPLLLITFGLAGIALWMTARSAALPRWTWPAYWAGVALGGLSLAILVVSGVP